MTRSRSSATPHEFESVTKEPAHVWPQRVPIAPDSKQRCSDRSMPWAPTRVSDVMTTHVIAVPASAMFKQIVDTITANRISAVPVIDAQRRVLGVVSESDLLVRVFGGQSTGARKRPGRSRPTRGQGVSARDLMSAPAVVATPNTSIAAAARIAAKARVRRLPVVDDAGALVGIVSRSDLLRPFLRPDAAIRDDIATNVVARTYVLSPSEVTVEVHDGVAELGGEVETTALRAALVESISSVSGVVDVDGGRIRARVDASRPSVFDMLACAIAEAGPRTPRGSSRRGS